MMEEMMKLPAGHPVREAYLECKNDKVARRWVDAFPSHECEVSNSEFTTGTAFYFGTPVPACAAYAHLPVPGRGSPKLVGPMGAALLASTHMKGGGTIKHHDGLLRRIEIEAEINGVAVRREVKGLFRTAIQGARGSSRGFHRLPWNARQGAIPDAALTFEGQTDVLYENKTMSPCPSRYLPCTEAALGDDGGCLCVRCRRSEPRAVDVRQDRIAPGVYASLRRLDSTLYGTVRNPVSGQEGPFVRCLMDKGGVRGLAFGAYGGVSRGVHALVMQLAEHGADRRWRAMGCLSASHCKGILAVMIQRRLCFAHWRGIDRNLQIRLGQLTGASSTSTSQARRADFADREGSYMPGQPCAPRQDAQWRRGWE